MTDAEVEYYSEHIPLMAARDAFPIAQMHADLLDFLKPRYLDPDPNPPKEPARRTQPWKPVELLPWYAYFTKPEPMPPEVAAALVKHYNSLPSWAKKLASIDEAKTVLSDGN